MVRHRAPRRALCPEAEAKMGRDMTDLKLNDDFLAYILVDTFGLDLDERHGVHYMDEEFEQRKPDFDRAQVYAVITKHIVRNGNLVAGEEAFMQLPVVQQHCKNSLDDDPTRIKTFLDHAKRYLGLYLPKCRVEITTTDRYRARTGRTELAVIATRDLASSSDRIFERRKAIPDENRPLLRSKQGRSRRREVNPILLELTGGLAPLNWEMRGQIDDLDENDYLEQPEPEAEESSEGDANDVDMCVDEPDASQQPVSKVKTLRDFSIVESKKFPAMLFLGPGRFINHDCDPNVELYANDGRSRSMTFKVIKPVKAGEEVYTNYGKGYFGPDNCECMCATCEKRGTGIYATLGKDKNNAKDDLAQGLFAANPVGSASNSPAAGGTFSLRIPPDSGESSRLKRTRSAVNGNQSQHGSRPGSRNSQRMDETAEAGPSTLSTPKRKRILADVSVTPHAQRQSPSGTYHAGSPGESPWRLDRIKRRAGELAQATVSQLYNDPFQRKRPRPDGWLPANEDESDMEMDARQPMPAAAVACIACLNPTLTDVVVGEHSIPLCSRCTRHHRIFALLWPAKHEDEMMEWPPTHVRPVGWQADRDNLRLRRKYAEGVALEKRRLREASPDETAAGTPSADHPVEDIEEPGLADWRGEELQQAAEAFVVAVERARALHEAILQAAAAEPVAEPAHTVKKGSGLWAKYVVVESDEEAANPPEPSPPRGRTRRGGIWRDAGPSAVPQHVRGAGGRARTRTDSIASTEPHSVTTPSTSSLFSTSDAVARSTSSEASDLLNANSPSMSNGEVEVDLPVRSPSPAPAAAAEVEDTVLSCAVKAAAELVLSDDLSSKEHKNEKAARAAEVESAEAELSESTALAGSAQSISKQALPSSMAPQPVALEPSDSPARSSSVSAKQHESPAQSLPPVALREEIDSPKRATPQQSSSTSSPQGRSPSLPPTPQRTPHRSPPQTNAVASSSKLPLRDRPSPIRKRIKPALPETKDHEAQLASGLSVADKLKQAATPTSRQASPPLRSAYKGKARADDMPRTPEMRPSNTAMFEVAHSVLASRGSDRSNPIDVESHVSPSKAPKRSSHSQTPNGANDSARIRPRDIPADITIVDLTDVDSPEGVIDLIDD